LKVEKADSEEDEEKKRDAGRGEDEPGKKWMEEQIMLQTILIIEKGLGMMMRKPNYVKKGSTIYTAQSSYNYKQLTFTKGGMVSSILIVWKKHHLWMHFSVMEW
jgi:hypothetical protein